MIDSQPPKKIHAWYGTGHSTPEGPLDAELGRDCGNDLHVIYVTDARWLRIHGFHSEYRWEQRATKLTDRIKYDSYAWSEPVAKAATEIGLTSK